MSSIVTRQSQYKKDAPMNNANTNNSARVVQIYGCGGGGVNLARSYLTETGPALKVGLVDTSRANIDGLDESQFYLIDGVDGSGKLRSKNVAIIQRSTGTILSRFAPGDLNIVLYTGSGGSGSVIGPALHAELLKRGQAVISVVICEASDMKSTDNSLKTLKTLSSLSEHLGQPVIVSLQHMFAANQRTEADTEAVRVIDDLTLLGRTDIIREMDRTDVENMLHYDAVTPFDPALAILSTYHTNEAVEAVRDAIVTASIYQSPEAQHADGISGYSNVGYIGDQGQAPRHYVVSNSGLRPVLDSLEKRLKMFADHITTVSNARVNVHNSDDISMGDFMVL